MRLKSASNLFMTRNLVIYGLFCSFGIVITSDFVHLDSGIELYMLAFIIVLWIISIILLNLSVLESFFSEIKRHL